jgi:hypothetical protein
MELKFKDLEEGGFFLVDFRDAPDILYKKTSAELALDLLSNKQRFIPPGYLVRQIEFDKSILLKNLS